VSGGRGSWIVSARRSFLDFFTSDVGIGGVRGVNAFRLPSALLLGSTAPMRAGNHQLRSALDVTAGVRFDRCQFIDTFALTPRISLKGSTVTSDLYQVATATA
jgi:hypothetical protein